MIEYIPPHARSAYERLMGSCRDLDAARSRAVDLDLTERVGHRRVTAELLARLASSPRASADMRRYADRVASGECSWERILVDANPMPSEVDELTADPRLEWPAQWPTSTTEAEPYRIPWK